MMLYKHRPYIIMNKRLKLDLHILTLNLYGIERGGLGFNIVEFPDGEKSIRLPFLDVPDTMDMLTSSDENVNCILHIVAPVRNADELFILQQVLKLTNNVKNRVVNIPYLMSARNDRDMGTASYPSIFITLQNIISMVQSVVSETEENSIQFIIEDIHNPDSLVDFGKFIGDDKSFSNRITRKDIVNKPGTLLVYPDEGALKRYGDIYPNVNYLVAKKNRNLETGWINSYEFDTSKIKWDKVSQIVIIDDLIDGGSTFKMLHKELKDLNKTLILIATHFIQTDKLIELSELYDFVFVTDSYNEVPEKYNIIKSESFRGDR